MGFIRKTNIRITTARRIVVKTGAEPMWCARCAAPMLTAQEAALAGNTSSVAIYRLIDEGSIHFVETENKIVYVCPNFTSPGLLSD